MGIRRACDRRSADRLGVADQLVRRASRSRSWAFCPAILAHGAEMAAMAGLAAVPEGLWPSLGDPRIDAVVSLAGGAFFGARGHAKSERSAVDDRRIGDTVFPAEWNIAITNEYASSAEKPRCPRGVTTIWSAVRATPPRG